MTTGHTVTSISLESAYIVKNKIKGMAGTAPSVHAVTGRPVTPLSHVFAINAKTTHVNAMEEFITYVQ